jgi:hypothetical protein
MTQTNFHAAKISNLAHLSTCGEHKKDRINDNSSLNKFLKLTEILILQIAGLTS